MSRGLEREANTLACVVNEGQRDWRQPGLAFSWCGAIECCLWNPPGQSKFWVKVKVH